MQKTIRRQEEAIHFARAFGANAYHVMVWAGPPGLSKTRTIEEVLGKANIVYLSGDVSPYQLYKDVYHSRQAGKIIIDDVETLIRDRLGTQLLKAFCQTEEMKSVGWHKATKDLEKDGIPRQYETSARFCLICNDEDAIRKHLGPVIDRGVLVRFLFPAKEVHRMVGQWLHVNGIDREVYDFIGNHLCYAKVPSARLYKTATDTKKSNPGIDWREAVLETFGLDEDEVEVARLFSNPEFPTNASRWPEFQRRGFGSRAKFYRIAGEMKLIGARAEGDVDERVAPSVPSPAISPIAPSVIMEALGFGSPDLGRMTEPEPGRNTVQAEAAVEAGAASPDIVDTLKKDERACVAKVTADSGMVHRNGQAIAEGDEIGDRGEYLSIPRVAVRANVTPPTLRAHLRKGKIPAPIIVPRGSEKYAPATAEQVVAYFNSRKKWGRLD